MLEVWKFRKFPVPFGISTWHESAPVPNVPNVPNVDYSRETELQDGGESFESAPVIVPTSSPGSQFEPVLDRKRKR